MKRFLIFAFLSAILGANPIMQAPLIVEFEVFKEAEKICKGSDYTKLKCLIEVLKPYANRIYTKKSGSSAEISVLFYALDSNHNITYPSNIEAKTCEFIDTLGKKTTSKLSGNGFSYALKYPLNASSSLSKAQISCYFTHQNNIISQTSQPISVIPHDFDMNLFIKTTQDSLYQLNTQARVTPNFSNIQAEDYESPINFVLGAQTHAININTSATARTISGDVDIGFSEMLIPLKIEFSRDNGLCNPVGESANGGFKFKGGRYVQNQIYINFLDVAHGELEMLIGHTLDIEDRNTGKCLLAPVSSIDITNAGKILCTQPIAIKKRVDIVPHSFFINIENEGKQIYYNQHTFLPAIPHLPTNKIEIVALNDRNQALKNYTKNCFSKDISLRLEDGKNDFVFLNENAPDSIVSKDSFRENSTSRVIRKLSSSGIGGRELTPVDAFMSSVLNLNDTYLRVEFYHTNASRTAYPVYFIKPKIRNDWRIALLRGRISLLPNTNSSSSMIANPRIVYEFYCKSPTCKIVDIESVLSPRARFVKSHTPDWYINAMHPSNLKVEAQNLMLPDNISIYSLGNIQNGVQTLALRSNISGVFDVSIMQNLNFTPFAPLNPAQDESSAQDLDSQNEPAQNAQNAMRENFATFLYFSPANNEIGAHSKIRF